MPLGVAVIQVGGTIGAWHHQADRAPLDALGIALLLAGPAALVGRGRYPAAVMGVVGAVSLAYLLLSYPYGPFFLSFVVAVFTAVRTGHRLVAWIVAALVLVGHFGLGTLAGERDRPNWTAALAVAAWVIIVLILAEIVRIRREQVLAARQARAAEADRRASEERVRIARELHDVVAHNISMINVQAGVALHVMDGRPEQARTSLTAIKQASKEALVELRSVLGVLRQVDEDLPRQPSPGLERLPELVERTRAAGVEAELRIEGERRAVPANIDLAAFRIVQEALTNVVRHAGASHAWVLVAYEDVSGEEGDVTVQIDDDGHGGHRAAATDPRSAGTDGRSGLTDLPPGGTGIAGMRERASFLSGEFEAGPRPGDGFRVRARLPLNQLDQEGSP